MLRIIILTSSLLSCLAGSAPVVAGNKCMEVGLDPERDPGLLVPASLEQCNAVWGSLQASRKFPHIFTAEQTRLYPGLCYVSTDAGIAGKLGDTPVTIATASAWTTDFYPTLIGGSDSLASVITQWSVKNSKNKKLGKVYTTDVIDVLNSIEADIVVGGNDNFEDAKGTLKVESETMENPLGANLPPLVKITNISGTLCLGN